MLGWSTEQQTNMLAGLTSNMLIALAEGDPNAGGTELTPREAFTWATAATGQRKPTARVNFDPATSLENADNVILFKTDGTWAGTFQLDAAQQIQVNQYGYLDVADLIASLV